MKRNLVRTAVAAGLGGAAMLSQAAVVYYSDWAYGNSWNNIVNVADPAHNGAAGGFKGSVTFEDTEKGQGFTDIAADGFISYCVEITENFYGFPSSQMQGYSVVAGALYATGNYAAWGADMANRLGQLVSYAKSNSQLVDTEDESTSLQLAIWNVIYDKDTDNTVTSGDFMEKTINGAFNDYADQLLANSLNYHAHQYGVYVLTNNGSQDFLLLRETSPDVTTGVGNVPEPGSLALAFAALGALGLVSRRREAAKA